MNQIYAVKQVTGRPLVWRELVNMLSENITANFTIYARYHLYSASLVDLISLGIVASLLVLNSSNREELHKSD